MTLSEEETNRLFRIRRIVLEMLKDRGYFVADKEIEMTMTEFKSKYGENMKREDLVINKSLRNDSSSQVSNFLFMDYLANFPLLRFYFFFIIFLIFNF